MSEHIESHIGEKSRCFDQFTLHRRTLEAIRDANEATTRLRAIDTTLFDVLAWDRTQVEAEKYCRTAGFADYALRCGDTPALIIEAKKQGISFLLPKRAFTAEAVGFGLLAQESPDAGDALRQAAGYATTLGARFVAITNGHQWIIGLTFVQDQPLEARSVVVFESLDALQSRFDNFWSMFSPKGICTNLPAQILLEARKRPAPKKLSASIPNYPAPATRNAIADELSTVIDLVWTGMDKAETSQAFLKRCYVIPGGAEDTLQLATELIAERRRSDELSRQRVVPTTKAIDVLRDSKPEKPILVLGRVGHGKSTFLRYLRLVEAREALTGYIQLDIDFLDRPDDERGVPAYIYSEIERQLRIQHAVDINEDGTVRGVLHSEIARFRKSPRGIAFPIESIEYKTAEIEFIESITSDRHQYLKHVFHHMKEGRGLSVAIFLDNLDRRLDPIQEEAFLRASAMARDWSCLVFVCLRPSTFHRSRHRGVLDSLAPKIISVTSPNPAIMLKKRFAFAAGIARGEDLGIEIETGKVSRNVAFNFPTVAQFLDCCLNSFWRNKSLLALFEAASNGNPRDLLRLVSDVLSSNHLNTRKILRKLDSGGYMMPMHEALRALLYGDSMHFSSMGSRFVNLYDIEHDDPREHFARLLALSFLQRTQPGSASLGYVSITNIERYLCQIGYSQGLVHGTIRYLYNTECIEGRISGIEWSDDVIEVRLTSLGKYHVNYLAGRFQYLDAVIVDTPITDRQVMAKVGDVTDIRERLTRCELFADYLLQCSDALQDMDARRIWADIDGDIRTDLRNVK